MDAGDGVCPGIVFVDRGFSFFVIFAASARFDIAVMRSIRLILKFIAYQKELDAAKNQGVDQSESYPCP